MLLPLILSFIFGSLIGSFLNVVILRLPKEQKLTGRSHCPVCRHQLSGLELVPLLSFLALKGKCRACSVPISARYFIIELVTGLLFAASWWLVDPSAALEFVLLARNFFVIAVLIVVFVVDLEYYIILDSVTFFALGVVTAFNIALDLSGHMDIFSLSSHFAGGLIGAAAAVVPLACLWYFSKGSWMGFGDVKLSLLLGNILGWKLFGVNFMLAVFLGTIVSVFLLLLTKKTLKSQIPFGTFLALGTVITLYYGNTLLAWYLSSLGL